jgi:predicted RNase H-like HicB family nuclease
MYVFPAVFFKTDTGYNVLFPDLPGCFSVGATLDEAHRMGKEALGLHLWGMERDGETIPSPSELEGLDVPKDGVPGLIEVWMLPVRAELDNRSIKKTLTIPFYLNDLAEKKKVNFSQVLQRALKNELGL